MIVLVKLAGHYINITRNDLNTYVIQSATPVFAALPILTNETKGDIGYSTFTYDNFKIFIKLK